MKNNTKFVCSLVLLALGACGDNLLAPDARTRPDTGSGSGSNGFPAAPSLAAGSQIDRIGRPAVNTLLNKGFEPNLGSAAASKEAYNKDESYATWVATWRGVFAPNLAVVDALDTGICGNGICEAGETTAGCAADCGAAVCGNNTCEPGETVATCVADCPTVDGSTRNGCGNAVLYNLGLPAGTGPNPASYIGLGSLLANDEIFINTGRAVCNFYLAVEYYIAQSMPGLETSCGGRAPQYDVVDVSLSMLSAGVGGFVLPAFTPRVQDGAGPHTDYLVPQAQTGTPTQFPYLGPPR